MLFVVFLFENHNSETPTMCEHCIVFPPHSFVYAFVCFSSLLLWLLLLRFISWYRSIRLYNNILNLFIHEPEFYSPKSSRKPIEWLTFCVSSLLVFVRVIFFFVCRFFLRPPRATHCLEFCFFRTSVYVFFY